ncbi:MAG: glycosyl hydrolase family 65 protein [Acidimicrobiales bacterium]
MPGSDGRLDQRFEALIFDWDGTAVPDRQADATSQRARVESCCQAGLNLFVVSGTSMENIDGQLRARPVGPGRLFLCCNRGSEIFEVFADGPELLHRRTATPEEDRCLDRAAELVVDHLAKAGLETKLVASRLNRRKIDLIPVPDWADPRKADIAHLADAVRSRLAVVGVADLAEVVSISADAARRAGLANPRITSDVKHVEIGLTDKSDSAQFAAAWLVERGITGALVLIGGDEFGRLGGVAGSDSLMMVSALARAAVVSVGEEPVGVSEPVLHVGGGPKRFAEILDEQLALRATRRTPQIDADPAWVVPLPTERARVRVAEALGTLGNGFVATRGVREEDGPLTSPLLLVNGAYTDDGHLLPGPDWTRLDLHAASSAPQSLDLRTGTLARFGNGRNSLRSLRFVSAASPYAMAMRAEGPVGSLEAGDPLRGSGSGGVEFDSEDLDGVRVGRTRSAGREIAVSARDRIGSADEVRTVERLASWSTAGTGEDSRRDAVQRLVEVDAIGFDALLAAHRQAWAQQWKDAEVIIEGDPDAQLAARFAVFHLLSAAADSGESAVGARGLSGGAYAGHVFWDADVFVLPALAALRPAAARAMLEYRIRRLPAARRAAENLGLRGARFPWESAGDGSDVTPREVQGRGGAVIPITTGPHEVHIVADVAWAASHYAAWTGDDDFLAGAGCDLITDTARFWASRIRIDAEGQGHLEGVEGPDEYHEVVDDNAFTNVMARWNLTQGATLLLRADPISPEARNWLSMAGCLVDGWNADRGLYEQFKGYFELEPLLMSGIASPPCAVDVLLGAERVAASQLVKQADVLMLHHLVPDEVAAGSLDPCLAFYGPRTAHGSSLSPAIWASLLARSGQPEQALEFFRMAARLDLDDLTSTTAGGLHLATMGGVWQALAFGFLGIRPARAAGEKTVLDVDPTLPETWTAVSLSFRLQGSRVTVRADHDKVDIACETPLLVRVAGRSPAACRPPHSSFRLKP